MVLNLKISNDEGIVYIDENFEMPERVEKRFVKLVKDLINFGLGEGYQ